MLCNMNLKQINGWKTYSFIIFFIILLIQFIYYVHVIQEPSILPSETDMVLVYSVDPIRIPAGINLARQYHASYFMVSDKGLHDLQNEIKKYGKPGTAQIFLEGEATTTDQNARFSAPMIRSLPVKTVILVTSWAHMPRALFLTRNYLFGSPVKVYPFPADSTPPGWWRENVFWQEYVKFWGSLGRVILATVGIQNWPGHFSI